MDSSKRLGSITSAVICVFIAIAAGFMAAMPWLLDKHTYELLGGRTVALIALYAGTAAGIWLLTELLFIMNSVKKGNPFVLRNVSALKRIAASCVIACAAVILVLCFRMSISFIICAMILAFGALTALTLSVVFRKAVEYKQENDLTI